MPSAVVFAPSQARQQEDALKALEQEARDRLDDARREKRQIENDLQNVYFYTAPRRVRRQGSQAASDANRSGDDRQLQTSFPQEVVDDFVTMLIDTFTPREGPWAERALPTDPDEEGQENPDIEAINKALAADDAKIFDLIRASNYYAEKAKTGVPDAAIGVVALMIDDPGKGQPVRCLGVPIRELEIDFGPDGRVDFRAQVRCTKYRHLRALLGKEIMAKLPDEIARKVRDEKNQACEVVWAWWRNWENDGDVEWRHVVLVDGKLVHEATLLGEGSCPLVVGRFGASCDFAWPDGPAIKALADFVQLDETRGALIENLDFTLRPPKAYEDDGVLNIPPDGIRPGDAFPKRPSGGRAAFEDIYEPRPLDAALFDVQMLRESIRRLHYVDFPEQRGKTPPTATQWIDELVIRQRRIGTPGYAFWREEPYDTFQRFRYIAEKRGLIRDEETLRRELRIPTGINLQPYNPAERAQDSQEVQTAVKFAELGQAIAPTMWQIMVDEERSLNNLKKKLRDKVISFVPEAKIKERIATFAQLGAEFVNQPRPAAEEK